MLQSPKRARAQTEVGMSTGYDHMAERLKALEHSVSQQQLRMQQLQIENDQLRNGASVVAGQLQQGQEDLKRSTAQTALRSDLSLSRLGSNQQQISQETGVLRQQQEAVASTTLTLANELENTKKRDSKLCTGYRCRNREYAADNPTAT